MHLAYWFSFFIFISIIKRYFNFFGLWFWIGGIFGTFLPDIDHLIYIFFVKPQELTSRRVSFYFANRELTKSLAVLYDTRGERTGLIFHTVLFQLIFLPFTFWIMSSSGSLFGRGLTLAFALHLSVDQIVDLVELGSFDNWLKTSPIKLDFAKSKIYWIVTFLLVLSFGFLM